MRRRLGALDSVAFEEPSDLVCVAEGGDVRSCDEDCLVGEGDDPDIDFRQAVD